MSHELNYNWTYRDYEARAVPRTLARLYKTDRNETIELVRWNESTCLTIAYFRYEEGGFRLILVGDRFFDQVRADDIQKVWLAMKDAKRVLDGWLDSGGMYDEIRDS